MKKIFLFLVLSFALLNTYSQAGSLDPSFAKKGWTDLQFLKSNLLDENGGFTVMLKSGKYLVVFDVNGLTVLARYSSSGALDGTFGKGGYSAPIPMTGPTVALQSNGKIVVVGSGSDPNNGSNISVARYSLNGILDNTFNSNGIASTDFGQSSFASNLAIQTDGKIVVTGQVANPVFPAFAVARYNTNGLLDKTFDGDGKQITGFPSGFASARAIAVQSDGKIVVTGYTSDGNSDDFALARYNTDGSLDNTFDGDGLVTTDFFGSDDDANAVAIQSDGKIIVAGNANTGSGNFDFALARYNSDGSLDDTFDDDGKTTSDFFGDYDDADAVAIQADGKIVAAGTANTVSGTSDFAIARYNSDGSLDGTFGSSGEQTTDFFGDYAQAGSVFVQSDGKIVAGGFVYNSAAGNSDFGLARYNSDGSLDANFSGDGKQTGYYPAGETDIYAMAVQPDGKIVVTGRAHSLRNDDDFAIARYNTDGSLDQSFSGDGKQTTNFFGDGDDANAVAIQADGKIVVAGSAFNIKTNKEVFALARYNSNGSMDKTLSADGKQTTAFPGAFTRAFAVAIQSDGKIVVAGYTSNGNGNSDDFALARYNTDGSLDQSFSGDGKQTTDFFNSEDDAYSIALQTDGKIVVAGHAQTNGNYDFALARYNSDGTIDNANFGVNGKVTTDFGNDVDLGESIVIQSDGKLVVAGSTNSSQTGGDFALARYNAEGTLDNSFDGDGMLTTDFGSEEQAFSVALQDDGKIVATGYSTANSGNFDFALARYNTNGTLDNSFDGDGKQTSDLTSFGDFPNASAISNNRIYVVGSYPEGDPNIGTHDIGIVAAYQTGPQTMAAPVIADASAVKGPPANEQALIQKFAAKVFPNPTTNYFTLQFNTEKTGAVNIKVFDVQGKLIETRTNVAINSSVQLGYNYRPGVYFAEIIQGNKKAVMKLVKQ